MKGLKTLLTFSPYSLNYLDWHLDNLWIKILAMIIVKMWKETMHPDYSELNRAQTEVWHHLQQLFERRRLNGMWSGGVKGNVFGDQTVTMLILFSVCPEYNRGWVLDDRHESGQQKCGTLEEKLLCRCIAEFNANNLFIALIWSKRWNTTYRDQRDQAFNRVIKPAD